MIRSFLADLALSLARMRKRQADIHKHKALRANRKAEFWSDVQAWLDRLDTWPRLRERRERRSRPPSHTAIEYRGAVF